MQKLVITTNGGIVIDLTPKEIAQMELEASLPPVIPPKTELELLQEENASLKGRVIRAEQILTTNTIVQQELLELLIDMEVI